MSNSSKQMYCCYSQSMSTTLLLLAVISKWRECFQTTLLCFFFRNPRRKHFIHNLQFLPRSKQVMPINDWSWSGWMSRCYHHQSMSCNLLLPVLCSKWRALPTTLVYFFLLFDHAKNISPTTFNFRPWADWLCNPYQQPEDFVINVVAAAALPNRQFEVSSLLQFVGHGPSHSLSRVWMCPLLLRRMRFPTECAGISGCNSYQENRVYFSQPI